MTQTVNTQRTAGPAKTISLPPVDGASLASSTTSIGQNSTNPFRLPCGGQWLSIRRRYASELHKQRAKDRSDDAHIYQKHTFRSRHTGGALPRLRRLLNTYDQEVEEGLRNANLSDVEMAFDIVKQKNSYRHQPIQREFVSDIIANKREIFLAEYVLQTKRQSLTKLQDKVQLAEIELVQAEKKLEKDALLFDDFLKETDKAAVDAMHEAERVTQIKMRLNETHKNLVQRKTALESEMSKFDERLFNYLVMKRFIWTVYSDQHPDNRHAKRVIQMINHMTKDAYDPNCGTLVNHAVAENLDNTVQVLPFENISDIINIITELEDSNLQMIHHFQHSEEVVEDMKNHQDKKKSNIMNTLNEITYHVKMLKQTIEQRERRARELAFVCKMYEVGSHCQDKQEKVLQELASKIEKVYKIVVGRLEIKIDGLMMLTSIENRLQDLIEEVEGFPSGTVRLAQKFKDKQRRLKVREEKLEKQKQRQEERAKRAQERAASMTQTKKGRRLVFRSNPTKMGHSEHFEKAQAHGEDQDKDAEFFKPDTFW